MMDEQNKNSKIVVAAVAGGVAGLMLGAYLWGKYDGKNPISGKLKTIVNAIEQLENINSDEANSLKEELSTLLHNLNTKYGKSEE